MPKYGFKVKYFQPHELEKAGFGKVAHIPAIFDSEPGYARLPSQFLIDRALGLWDPVWRGSRPAYKKPSRTSVKNNAYWLCNCLEWAEARGLDLMTAEYSSDLLGRYQIEMLKGIWSSRGTPLSETTVNLRVQTALDYQMWGADKGHRASFEIPTQTRSFVLESSKKARSFEIKSVESRQGKAKVNKRTLSFPSDEEIWAWRGRIYGRPVIGKTEGLMVDHVLNTAIRREELACWRVDTIPLDQEDWNIVNKDQPKEVWQISIEIKMGAKGTEYYIDEHDDKVGPQDSILVPHWLAIRIDQYRNGERLNALKKLTKGVRDPLKARKLLKNSVHLYINPKTGTRYTGSQIYEFWTAVDRPRHWSPHLARDWWACQYLWDKMQEHISLIKKIQRDSVLDADHPLMRALKDTMQTVIQLEIRPQLRHARSATSEIYLEWLFNRLRTPLGLSRKWLEELDSI